MSLFSAVPARRRRLFFAAFAACTLALLVVRVPGAAADIATAHILSPNSGGVVGVGTPLIVAGTSPNGEGEFTDRVEVSVDGGANWDGATGNWSWMYVYTPTEPGELTILARAVLGGVTKVGPDVRHVTVGTPTGPPPALNCPCEMPLPYVNGVSLMVDPDNSSVEVGVRFQVDRPGFITGLRITRQPYTDPIVAHLWTADGRLLASRPVSVTSRFAFTVTFDEPVPVRAGEAYVASYFTPDGHYDSGVDYYLGALVSPPFVTVFDEAGGAGVYQYSDTPAFPTLTWNNSNYWVAPTFTT